MNDRTTPQTRPGDLPLSGFRSGIGAGTPVMTTNGLIPAGYLAPGDRIVTFDAGALRLERLGFCDIPARAALLVRPTMLDPADTSPDMVIAARQLLLIRGWRAWAMFGKRMAVVEAARMIDGAYVARMTGTAPVRLIVLGLAGGEHVIQLGGGFEMLSARAVESVG